MIPLVLVSSLGLVVGGLPGAVVGALLARLWWRREGRATPAPSRRVVMMLLLVELRSGLSVLAALQRTAERLPAHHELQTVSRVATVSGLAAAIPRADGDLRPVVAQLARAQKSGASLSAAVRRMLEQDLARERSDRLARARALPVRLMLPVTLLMLPGLVLFLYAPSLIRTFGQLTGGWP